MAMPLDALAAAAAADEALAAGDGLIISRSDTRKLF
jgi:hypothetical protein